MPRVSAERPARTVTLIADGSAEVAQATLWRPIAARWPAFALPAELQVLSWREAADPEVECRGSVALVWGVGDKSASQLFTLLDRLREEAVGAVLVVEPGEDHPVALEDDGALVIDRATAPEILAAVLAAQAERQPTVESLRGELGMARRFHGGLRGQMEKIHEELQLAASVQREFLPRELPRAGAVDIQVLFRPCGYVSGDIYDVQRLDEHRLGFFIADAVGHGVPAALMTMVLCRCLRTKEFRDGREVTLAPGEALASLNRQMVERHGDTPRFATAVYGVIDIRTRAVTIAGAGHPHPLRIRGDQVDRVMTEGGLLGVFPDAEFDEARFILEPDELLVVYSDGFETAFPAPAADEYGRRRPNTHYLRRFVDMAATWNREGLAAALQGLGDQINRQAGSLHQVDDLTALAIAASPENGLDRLFAGKAGMAAGRTGLGTRASVSA